MKVIEFPAQLSSDGSIKVPAKLRRKLPRNRKFRAIFVIGEDDKEDEDWLKLAAEQFLAGYYDTDAIYDKA